MGTVNQPGSHSASKTRTTDAKARVALPKDFANTNVEIEIIDQFEVRIRKVRTIPEREIWLWQNNAALTSVMTGLEQAKAGEIRPGIDPEANLAEFAEFDDEEDLDDD